MYPRCFIIEKIETEILIFLYFSIRYKNIDIKSSLKKGIKGITNRYTTLLPS